MKNKGRPVQKILQRYGLQRLLQHHLGLPPYPPGFAVRKSAAAFRLAGPTLGKFQSPFHQLYNASEGDFARSARQNAPPFHAPNAGRNARQTKLAQNLFDKLLAYTCFC